MTVYPWWVRLVFVLEGRTALVVLLVLALVAVALGVVGVLIAS